MSDCIFCKIATGEIPGHKLYEDDHVLAFLDISQTTKGHALVIPKNHAKDIYEMTAEDMAHVYSVIPSLATALKKTFKCSGLNLVNNNESAAGQTVFHYHVHLIPRYENDNFRIKFASTEEDLAGLKAQILSNLGSVQTGEL